MENIMMVAVMAYAFLFMASSAFNFYMMPIIAVGSVFGYLKNRVIKVGYKPVLYNYLFILVVGLIFNYFSSSKYMGMFVFSITNTYFAYSYIFLNAVSQKKSLNVIINGLVVGGVTLSLICITQYYQELMRNGFNYAGTAGFRPSGLVEYFFAGLYLIYTGFFLYSKLLNGDYLSKGKKEKLYFIAILIGFILNFEAIIMNKSRAAIYGFIFTCSLMTLYSLKRQWRKGLMCLILLFGVYLSTPKFIRGYSEHIPINVTEGIEGNPRHKSDNMRSLVYSGAWEIYKKHPIFGIGNDHRWSSYWMQTYLRDRVQLEDERVKYADQREVKIMSEAHSMYLNILMKNGILILAFLAQFFIIIPMLFFKVMRRAKEERDIVNIMGAGGGILGFLITGITWYNWNYLVEIQEIFQFMTFILLFYYQKLVVEGEHLREKNSVEESLDQNSES